MRVAVIAAHPDDEVLGAGGTLVAHVRAGDEVHAMILSEGCTSRYDAEMAQVLRKAAEEAAEQIGFTSLTLAQFPDQRLDAVPLLEVTQRIEAVLDRVRPHTVYTHFPGDVNADHGVVARAAWTACRPYRLPELRRFAVFETPSSTEWAWPYGDATLGANLFVDVTETFDTKLTAMGCYSTELRDYPHPRSLRALTERAAYWGSHVGRRYAEPFRVLREVTP